MKLLILEHAPNRAHGIENTVLAVDPAAEITIAQVYLGVALPNFRDFDALIPGGGPMGVYEIHKPEYDYILREADFLKNAIDAGSPILGICFGHQLIAHIQGGEVIRNEDKSEIGWFKVHQNDQGQQSDIFKGLPPEFTMFQYHYDHIVTAPADTRVLATSGHSDIQALEYLNLPIHSVQFHPEVNASQGKAIFESMRTKLESRGYDVDLLIQQASTLSEATRVQLFANFLSLLT